MSVASLAKWCSRTWPAMRPAEVLHIFSMKDHYSVFMDEAVYVAREYYKTIGALKYPAEEPTDATKRHPYINLSEAMFETVVRDTLMNKGGRVELWNPNSSGNPVCIKQGSPGNLQHFEEVLFGGSVELTDSPVVLAVKLGGGGASREVGVAIADATLRTVGMSEFTDNDAFANFEGIVIQVGAKEAVLDGSAPPNDVAKLKSILERAGVLVNVEKRTVFNAKDVEGDLSKLLPEGKMAAHLPELEKKIALSSLGALIKYLDLLGSPDNYGSFSLNSVNLSNFMRLDTCALAALNLVPMVGGTLSMNTSGAGSRGTASLFGLMNRCKTAMGSRKLLQWLKQPLLEADAINARLDLVGAFVDDSMLRSALQDDHLRGIPDMDRLAKKMAKGRGSLSDVVRVYQVIHSLPSLTDALRGPVNAASEQELASNAGLGLMKARFVDPLIAAIKDFVKFVELVETTVDLDNMSSVGKPMIRADFDEDLGSVRNELDIVEKDLYRATRAAQSDLGLGEKVYLEYKNHLGWHWRVSKKDEKTVSRDKQYTSLGSAKDGMKFQNDRIRNLSDEYRRLQETYSAKQAEVEGQILDIASTYTAVVEDLNALIAELDVLVSFADVAVTAPIPYVRPELTEAGTGDTVLIGARHPCLEAQDGVAYIPNDVSLTRGEGKSGGRFHIITGPNMGGKSTYIRSVGVIVLMAQVGAFVPATSAKVSITDAILARVGAGDSQQRGVSTFMAEMLETATILKTATSKSLLLIDELGRGTSTYDGFGLAWAISEYIVRKLGSFGLFATHFHELTALEASYPGVVANSHVTALTSANTLTLLYRVRSGPSDESFGIHVAELAGFPEPVVKSAKRKAAELEHDSDVKLMEERDGKKARTDQHTLISEWMADWRSLDLESVGREEGMKRVNAFRQRVKASAPPEVLSELFGLASN